MTYGACTEFPWLLESLWLIIYRKDRRSRYIWISVCIRRSLVGVLWVVKWKASICSRLEKLSPFSLSCPFWLLTMSRAAVVRLLTKVLIARKPGKSVTSLLSSQSASGPPGSEAPGFPSRSLFRGALLCHTCSMRGSHNWEKDHIDKMKLEGQASSVGGIGALSPVQPCSVVCLHLLWFRVLREEVLSPLWM